MERWHGEMVGWSTNKAVLFWGEGSGQDLFFSSAPFHQNPVPLLCSPRVGKGSQLRADFSAISHGSDIGKSLKGELQEKSNLIQSSFG